MSTAAKVYARSFYEVCSSRGDFDAGFADLNSFHEMCQKSSELGSITLKSTVVGAKRVAGVVKDLAAAAGLGKSASTFLIYLAAKRRLPDLPEILSTLEIMKERSRGVELGVIESATEMSADDYAGLVKAVEKRIEKTVKLEKKIVPGLLGGAVIRVDGKTYDASLRTQLEKFRSGLV